jgi:phosphohistidine phosphatase SixA
MNEARTVARVSAARFLFALLLLAPSARAYGQSGADAELLLNLRKGGYVLFIRHLDTNSDQADTDPLHLENVKAQRQLSEEGRARAKALGEALRKLGISAERVLTSKFKRAQDTAQLLALGPSESSVDLTEGGLVVSPRENQRRAAALRALLSQPRASSQNLVIVSHRPNLQEAAGKEFGDLAEGEVAIFQPLSSGKYKLVQRVPVATWLKWAQAPTERGAGLAPSSVRGATLGRVCSQTRNAS